MAIFSGGCCFFFLFCLFVLIAVTPSLLQDVFISKISIFEMNYYNEFSF